MLDFFDETYQEPPINDALFGLCDNEDGNAAFANKINKDKWIAIVENNDRLALTFTAIDKGIIKDDECPGLERCDGMLTSENCLHLYFVELKNERGEWIQKGISQLGSTIKLFNETHPDKKKNYIHKKAYVCNKKHPHFYVINDGQNLNFFKTHRFRLDIQAKISVVV